jgi:DNA polymerase IIIc chi subunit
MTAPCEVWFYHLERTSADKVLPELLEKTLKRGWKAQVRTASQDRVEFLDDWLWRYRDEAFLPHAPASEPMPERQPILVGADVANANGAEALFLLANGHMAMNRFDLARQLYYRRFPTLYIHTVLGTLDTTSCKLIIATDLSNSDTAVDLGLTCDGW